MDDVDEVRAFLETVTPSRRKADAETLLEMMSRVTGEPPKLYYGKVIGFGQYHYRYASGREGDASAAGFAPAKAATTVYLPDGIGRYTEQLERLGPHSVGLVCLYIRNLDKVDLGVLEEIVTSSFRAVSSGTYTMRAREGRPKA